MSDNTKGIPADALPFVRLVIATHLLSSSKVLHLTLPDASQAVDHAYSIADLIIEKAGL